MERNELIGLNVNVVGRKISGKIIDETKNTLVIETKKDKKMIIKKDNEFEFILMNKKIVVNGKNLALRPEDRIKKR